ncbi:MAG: hypothetical protein GXP49_12415 [Deltaproteobacteria bacterium]|nr:hypothetical protein [Deltaproteobacteria bacterium]
MSYNSPKNSFFELVEELKSGLISFDLNKINSNISLIEEELAFMTVHATQIKPDLDVLKRNLGPTLALALRGAMLAENDVQQVLGSCRRA